MTGSIAVPQRGLPGNPRVTRCLRDSRLKGKGGLNRRSDLRRGNPEPQHARLTRLPRGICPSTPASAARDPADTKSARPRLAPRSSVTASSRGCTKPVYDGRFSRSTRATTSSRSAGSKCMPYASNSAFARVVVALGLDALHFGQQPARAFAERRGVHHHVVRLAVAPPHVDRVGVRHQPVDDHLAVAHVIFFDRRALAHAPQLHERIARVGLVLGLHDLRLMLGRQQPDLAQSSAPARSTARRGPRAPPRSTEYCSFSASCGCPSRCSATRPDPCPSTS